MSQPSPTPDPAWRASGAPAAPPLATPPPQGGSLASHVHGAPPARRRRWLVAVVGLCVIAVVSGVAVVVVGGGDDADGTGRGGADTGPDPAGVVAWQRGDFGRVVGVLGDTVLVDAAGSDLPALVDLGSGEQVTRLPVSFGSSRWSDGELLLGVRDGTTAVDLDTGEVVWEHELHAEDLPGSGVVVGRVFDDATDLDDVVALEVGTGEELWRVEAVAADGPWIDDGLVVWSDGERVLHAVDARTGAARWTADGYQLAGGVTPLTRGGPPGSEPDDGVVLAYDADQLVALDAVDGVERWRAGPWDPDGNDVLLFGGDIVLSSGDEGEGLSTYVGLDPGTGEEQWRVDTGDDAFSFLFPLGPRHLIVASSESSASAASTVRIIGVETRNVTVVEVDGRVYDAAGDDQVVAVVSDDGTITAFAPADGAVLWRAVDEPFGAVTIAGSTVVARGTHGDLVGFDATSGDERWRVDVGATEGFVFATPEGVLGGGGDGPGFLVR
jgi:outer membrane protein assembly factor BamB